jgi:hypothetical protein
LRKTVSSRRPHAVDERLQARPCGVRS